jgi:hypothetical protein
MSIGIGDSAQAPAVAPSDRENLGRARFDGARLDLVRISNGEDDAHG